MSDGLTGGYIIIKKLCHTKINFSFLPLSYPFYPDSDHIIILPMTMEMMMMGINRKFKVNK